MLYGALGNPRAGAADDCPSGVTIAVSHVPLKSSKKGHGRVEGTPGRALQAGYFKW